MAEAPLRLRRVGEAWSGGVGPPLVLAHGAAGSVMASFAQLAPLLLETRTVHGWDYPGSGRTPPAEGPLRLEDLADSLVASAKEGGHERFPILGYSMGCAVAICAAVQHPRTVTGLVLAAGFAGADAQSATFSKLYASLARDGRVEDLGRLLTLVSSPEMLAELADPEPLVAGLAREHRRSAGRLAPQMDLAVSLDVRELLGRIAVPTLVVVAGQDRVVLPSTTRALAAGIPGAQLAEWSESGHVPGPTGTAPRAELILDFLARHGL